MGRCNKRSLSLHVAYLHHNGLSHLKKGVYFTLLPKPSGKLHIAHELYVYTERKVINITPTYVRKQNQPKG
jgi:hypothetical protein